MLEQVADLKRHRFGRSSERHEVDEQISFMEVDGEIVFFNESEAVAAEEAGEEEGAAPRRRPKKRQGKQEEDLEGQPCLPFAGGGRNERQVCQRGAALPPGTGVCRNANHPGEFLEDFSGICVTDGYQVYHTVEEEREDLKIAGCWSHARQRFDEAVKALPKAAQKGSRAYLALTMI